MRRMRMSLMSLIVFAMIAGPMIALDAEAGVRFDATFRTDNMRVRVGNIRSDYYRIHRRRPMPVRRHRGYEVGRQDRQIAYRIGRYTGIPAWELVQLRRYGYSWLEIGRWLELPRYAVRAAMHKKSWKRFLREEQRFAMRTAPRHGRRR
ncbi:MAG: hypothetical protein KAV42_05300 [Candidatus Krumholzibacteria bacterium]|nr:hypothetical protein [Candidatus Krumholzibacteria bacterium]